MHSLSITQLKFPILAVILLIGLICVAKVNASEVDGELQLKGVKEQRVFDYFKLALQWPGTYCRNTKSCCDQNGCCWGSNSPTEFTIHGLWADYNDGSWPSCCEGNEFDVNEVTTLLPALNKYWPTLSCSSSKNCHGGKGLFWEHEWEKHGTCSASVTGDEYNYFVTALNLYFKYNVTEILREAGYVASNTEKYPAAGIISAIENVFHATPELDCSGDALEELYLCFYKDFKPRDCVIESSTKSGMVNSICPAYVSLPELSTLNLGHRHGGAEVPQTLQSSM